MTTKTGLYTAGWALSCGAAFLIGKTSSDAPPEEMAGEQDSQVEIRTISQSGGTATGTVGGRNGKRTIAGKGSGISSEDALQKLLDLDDPIARAAGFVELVKTLQPEEFEGVVALYRSFGISDENFGEYSILLTAWARVAPEQALDYAQENTGSPFARQTILASWAKDDPEAAVAWAKDNFEAGERNNRANPWLIGVIKGLASSDLGRATELLEELPFSRGRFEALNSVFKELNKNGTEVSKQWVSQLADERLQAGAAGRLAQKIAETNPKEAIEWASSLGPEALKNSANPIVETWASNDLDSAQAWVESQSTEIAAKAAPGIIENMIKQKDVSTASAWLSQYEGQPEFDEPVRAFVWETFQETPELGADWIMKITNERTRTRTFHQAIGGWFRRDLDGAKDYIENNPVPESIQRRLTQHLSNK